MVAAGTIARTRFSHAAGAAFLPVAAASGALVGAATASGMLDPGAGGVAFLAAGSGVAGRTASLGRSVRRGSILLGAGADMGCAAGVTSCGGAAAGVGAAMPAACRAKRLTAA